MVNNNTGENMIERLEHIRENNSDFIIKKIKISLNNYLYIIFLESLTSSDKINDYILKDIINNKKNINQKTLSSLIAASNTSNIKEDEIFNYISNGYAVIIYKNEIIAIEVKADINRSINIPSSEPSLTGPKDSFNENYQTNIGLIKRRIKDKSLVIHNMNIGSLTKTNIGVLYIDNLTDHTLVKIIIEKLESINIDSILDSRDLSLKLENNNYYFPTILKTERPDIACKSLLEGKIVISVDTSCDALILPAFFIDFINPKVDNYTKGKNINFIKILRLFCFLVSLLFPAFYISLINYNQETIPTSLLINFSIQRNSVPFPAAIEAFIMIILCEILRESDLRFPNSYGSAISILGALIIGEAAVSAGIVSPIMIIVIAITFITSLVFTEYDLNNALRHYRFIFLLGAVFYGIFGIVLLAICFLTKLNSINNYTSSYLYPIAPYNKKYFFKTLLKKKG